MYKTNEKIINLLSIAIPLAVAVLIGIPTKLPLGDWTKTLPHAIGLLNSTTAISLILGLIAIKNKNINLWVVSYGDVGGPTNDRLRACATPGKFFQATSVASLVSNFKEIAAKISALRLTQ